MTTLNREVTVTRRAAIAASLVGILWMWGPQEASAMDSLIITSIQNGWMVESRSTGEKGTIEFIDNTKCASVIYPDGRVCHFVYREDGWTVIDDRSPRYVNRSIARLVPSGFSFLGTARYDFGALDLVGTALTLIGIGLGVSKAHAVASAVFTALGYGADKLADLSLEIDTFLNRKTTESYWSCRVYNNSKLVYRFEVGPFTGSRPAS